MFHGQQLRVLIFMAPLLLLRGRHSESRLLMDSKLVLTGSLTFGCHRKNLPESPHRWTDSTANKHGADAEQAPAQGNTPNYAIPQSRKAPLRSWDNEFELFAGREGAIELESDASRGKIGQHRGLEFDAFIV